MTTKKELISPSSISLETITKNIQEYINSQPDSAKWTDYLYHGSVGTTVGDLLSGVAAFCKYTGLVASREGFIGTAKLASTIYAAAYHLDYPVNRKKGARFQISFTLSQGLYLAKFVPIATLNGENLSVPFENFYPAGNHTIDVVLGAWESTSAIAEGGNYSTQTIPIDDVTSIDNELLEVFSNNTQVSTSKITSDMFSTRSSHLIVATLSDAIALKNGSDNTGIKLPNGTSITLKYLRVPANSNSYLVDYSLPNVESKYESMTITDLKLVSPPSDEDSLSKIATIAPAYSSTIGRAVTPPDYEVVVNAYPGVIDAKYNYGVCSIEGYFDQTSCLAQDGATWNNGRTGCCTRQVSYLFSDDHMMLPNEITVFNEYLKDFLLDGAAIDPVYRNIKNVTPEVVVLIPEGADTTLLETKILKVLNKQTNVLGGTFDVGEVNADLADIDEIIKAYLKKPLSDKRLQYHTCFRLLNPIITFSTQTNNLDSFGGQSEEGYS